MSAMVRRLHKLIVLLVLSGLLANVACGPSSGGALGGLTAADKRACDDAAQIDAQSLVTDAQAASNSEIRQQAATITQTSDPNADTKAMQTIVQVCKQHGYSPSGAGVIGGGGQTNHASPAPSARQSFTKPPAHGILECAWNGIGPPGVLVIADPNNGKAIWTQPPPTPSTSGWSSNACTGTARGVGSPLLDYSNDFRRVTAINGSGDIGWIDVATGAVTDITQRYPAPSPGFGQSPSVDSNPTFDPKDNSFWFQRRLLDGSIAVLRLPNGASSTETMGMLSSATDTWLISESGNFEDLDVLAQHAQSIIDCCFISANYIAISPGGMAAFACGVASDGSLVCAIASPPDGTWRAVTVSGYAASSFQIGSSFVWITDATLVAPPAGNSIYLLTVTGTSVNVATLIPQSEANSGSFVASPDGNTAMFIATSPSTSNAPYLYAIPLAAPGSPPKQIGPVGPGVFLVAWR